MKTAVRALANLLRRIASAIGTEGLFLTLGTALLAVGASFLSAAGPWLVTGAVLTLVALALAMPRGGNDGSYR